VTNPKRNGEVADDLRDETSESAGLELIAVALAGHHEIATALLAKGADPLAENQEGISAFLVPALRGDVQMQRLFLEAGISADLSMSNAGVTALMAAAARGSRPICDVLLDAGCDVNKLMGSGEPFFSHPKGIEFQMSALGCAIDAMHWDLALHLIERGAAPIFGAMHFDIALTLAKFAPLELIKKLHHLGYCIVMDHEFMMLFAPPLEMQLPQMRSKVVFWAAANPDSRVLCWVLDRGGDSLADNSLGMTPLIVAATVGNVSLVERLLAEGADPSVRDCDGDTALSLALERGHKKVVTALRRHAAKHATPSEVALAVHQAAAVGDGFALLDCIDQGVSPNLRDERGCTPLMLAAQAGQVAALRILVALGGSVRTRNDEGKNAWDLAADPSESPIRVSLQEFGADNPQRKQDDRRFDSYACILGRFSHPFKYPNRNP